MPAAWRRTTRASAGGSSPPFPMARPVGARPLMCHVSGGLHPLAPSRPARMRGAKVASLARAALRTQAAAPSRGMAAGTPSYTGTVYKESEKARENAYFSKEDEKALRKLLTKVKSSADAACATAGAHSAKEEAALTAIVGKYKLDAKDVQGARPGARAGRQRARAAPGGCARVSGLTGHAR